MPLATTMKIIFTVASLTPESGGPARTVPALSSSLADLGTGSKIEIITLDAGKKSFCQPLMPANRQVETAFIPRGHLWPQAHAFERRLKRDCAGDSPCLIHDNGVWLATNHAAARAARRQGKTLVLSPRGMLTKWSLGYRGLKKKLAMRAYQRRDLGSVRCFHASSEQEAEDLRSLGLTQPIAVIPNGVNIPSAERLTPPGTNGARTVLFLSRISPKKGLLDLVKAWSLLRPRGWRVLIAGPDEENHRNAVLRAVRDEGLEDRFTFAGMVPDEDKWRVYSSAGLFVLPSYSENFGLAVAEAMACGVPVITTRGTPWESIAKNGCGWWIESGSGPLASALKEALAMSDGQRKEMGARGRKLAENFSWDKIARQMSAVYSWLCGQAEKPDCVF